MNTKEFLEQWVAPRVTADGGWLEYAGETETELRLKAKGECARCIARDRCIRWVAARLQEKTGMNKTITVESDPFVWRK